MTLWALAKNAKSAKMNRFALFASSREATDGVDSRAEDRVSGFSARSDCFLGTSEPAKLSHPLPLHECYPTAEDWAGPSFLLCARRPRPAGVGPLAFDRGGGTI